MLQDWLKSKNPDLFCIGLYGIYMCWNKYKFGNSRFLNARDQSFYLALCMSTQNVEGILWTPSSTSMRIFQRISMKTEGAT